MEPELVVQALEQIGTLYTLEAQGREQKLGDEAKQRHRLSYAQPVVEQFFIWLERTLREVVLVPSILFAERPTMRSTAARP